MLTKDEAVEVLKERGYEAYAKDGILFIKTTQEQSVDPKFFDKMRSLLKEIGYRNSWGYGVMKGDPNASS